MYPKRSVQFPIGCAAAVIDLDNLLHRGFDKRTRCPQPQAKLDILGICAAPVPPAAWCELVTDVLLLLGSSRGGTSVTAELLRGDARLPRHLLSLRAEINPALRLLGLTPPNRPDDRLHQSDLADLKTSGHIATLNRLMHIDLGWPVDRVASPEAFIRFTEAVWQRLSWAWPDEEFSFGEVLEHLGDLISPDEWVDIRRVWAALLTKLTLLHPRVDSRFYDLGEHRPPLGWPSPLGRIVEEPPFVPISPIEGPTMAQLERTPVLIKTPANAYRLPFLLGLFPNARMRIIHLVRHPGASIRGLVDGWRYSFGFNYCDIPGLEVQSAPPGRWCFDQPPGWKGFDKADLCTVAAFQWHSAHAAVLHGVAHHRLEVHRIQFERLLQPSTMIGTLRELSAFIFGDDRLCTLARPMRPTMSTVQPNPDRWRSDEAALRPVLDLPHVRQMAKELGYEL